MSIYARCRGRIQSVSFLSTLLLVTGGALPASAQALDAEKVCELRCTPRKQEHPFVEIDANTGEVLAGATTFAEGEKVKVIVSGKNPYKYDYQTNIKSSPLETSLFTSFLALIPGAENIASLFAGGLPEQPGRRESSQPSGAPGAPAPLGCSPHVTRLNTLIELSDDLSAQNNKLQEMAKTIDDSHTKYRAFVLTTDRDSLGSQEECQKICTDSAGLLPHLGRLTDLQSFEAEVRKLQESAKSLGDQVSEFKKAIGTTCAEQFKAELNKIEERAKDAAGRAVAALAKVEEMKKAKPALELLGQRIRKSLADNDAFSEERFPYTQGGPTGVKITLFRKNLREENAKEKEVGQVDLTVGQSRFSLSGGVGFSTIEDVTIVKQGNKFAEENESDLRPSLTLMLNSRLKNFSANPEPILDSFGLATGLVLTSRNNTMEAEFIVGPSFGFLDDRFFVVLGYHTARVQSLRSKDIPADTTDIPIDKDWESGAMLAFTYKIR